MNIQESLILRKGYAGIHMGSVTWGRGRHKQKSLTQLIGQRYGLCSITRTAIEPTVGTCRILHHYYQIKHRFSILLRNFDNWSPPIFTPDPAYKRERERERSTKNTKRPKLYCSFPPMAFALLLPPRRPYSFFRWIQRKRFRWRGEGSYGLSTCGGFETKSWRWRMHWIVRVEFGRGENISCIKNQNWKRKGQMWMIGFHIKTTPPKCTTISRGFDY